MRPFAVAFALCAGASALPAQVAEPPEAIELEGFRLSAPPALALLGIAPSSVSRPNTPRALIASLVSGTGSSGLVPNGYAVETSPYWLSRHPSLDLDHYYKASLGRRLIYFTALSAATSRPSSSDSIAPDARVSIALRTLLANGRPSRALSAVADTMRRLQIAYIEQYRRWEAAQAASSRLATQRTRLARNEDLLSTLTTKLIAGDTKLRDSTLRVLARRDSARSQVAAAESADEDVTRLEKQMTNSEERLSRLAKAFVERDAEPDGFVLEVAAGVRSVFARGEWDRARTDGIGLWMTPMYRLSAKHVEVIGVLRYLTRVVELDGEDVFDAGARAGVTIGRGTFSGELVRRTVRDDSDMSSSRWAALFDYPLPARLHLVASFGSDYRLGSGRRPVIATLGVNLGVGAVELISR
ncbi:MAG TPA: hypothetical protein VJL35_12500 [Gemmatimonadaceae bacterium]|nr:hypothetical protein [Gemmatimonadaceae bacterium]